MTGAARPTAGLSWPAAAADLAARATRRERAAALLPRVAVGLVVGAAAAGAMRLSGEPIGASTWLAAAVPACLGAALGLVAASRVASTSPAAAAWALDRVAGAGERGLAAATLEGPAAAEAAFSSPPVAPPRVRLRPPAGATAALAAALLAAMPFVAAPSTRRAAGTGHRPPSEATAAGGDAAIDAARLEAQARAAAREAAAARRVGEALAIPADAPVAAEDVAARLASPAAAAAAKAAAPPDSDAAAALARGPAGVADLARALSGEWAESAEGLRRAAAAARVAAGTAPVPPARREVVARWLELRAEAAARTPMPEEGAPR